MKTKLMPIAKRAIQELTGDQLELLSKFGKSKEYELLRELADKEKYQRYQIDFLTASTIEQINFLRGINVGIDFILDSVNRAQEELRNRGDKGEFDNAD